MAEVAPAKLATMLGSTIQVWSWPPSAPFLKALEELELSLRTPSDRYPLPYLISCVGLTKSRVEFQAFLKTPQAEDLKRAIPVLLEKLIKGVQHLLVNPEESSKCLEQASLLLRILRNLCAQNLASSQDLLKYVTSIA